MRGVKQPPRKSVGSSISSNDTHIKPQVKNAARITEKQFKELAAMKTYEEWSALQKAPPVKPAPVLKRMRIYSRFRKTPEVVEEESRYSSLLDWTNNHSWAVLLGLALVLGGGIGGVIEALNMYWLHVAAAILIAVAWVYFPATPPPPAPAGFATHSKDYPVRDFPPTYPHDGTVGCRMTSLEPEYGVDGPTSAERRDLYHMNGMIAFGYYSYYDDDCYPEIVKFVLDKRSGSTLHKTCLQAIDDMVAREFPSDIYGMDARLNSVMVAFQALQMRSDRKDRTLSYSLTGIIPEGSMYS